VTLSFHPAVQADFNEAIAYYEAEGGVHLADRFEAEFRACLAAIKTGPTHHPFYYAQSSYRRIQLRSFPYLILYQERPETIRITLLKHERQHPLYGSGRK
jgi:plasmid stabilization system protein ParE